MVRPNFIPRTLRGVGGIRLFDIPGVIYPKEMLVRNAGMSRKDGRPYREAPSWGVTSREAAGLLGCTPSAARSWLHRRKVPYRIVSEEGQTLRIFWRKDKVTALAESRLPIVKHCPSSLITSMEALRILHVGRSTLHRYQERGVLTVTRVRRPSERGLRKCSYFRRPEVEQLARHLACVRNKEEEINHIRSLVYHTDSHRHSPSHDKPPPPPSKKLNKKNCT